MRARGSKSGVKNETPKLPETRESLVKIRIFLLLNSDFPHTKSYFLQRLSAFQEIRENLLQRLTTFFNGFLLSSMAFHFLQRLSAFFNGFPISSTAFQFSSTAFLFPRNPRKSIYGGKYTKDHYLSIVFPATCSPSFVIPAN
jgi:hypothetical protein